MTHIVSYEKYVCPKCCKENFGSAETILNLVVCSKCYEKFSKELKPEIEDMILNYFQPERSKREDVLGDCETMGHMNTWMPKNQTLCMRCGALNSMET